MDFVTRFNDNWDALRTILGIMRPIRKTPGTQLISYTADVTLEDGDVDPGNVIPYSKATITPSKKADLTIKKYAKAVPIEDVDKYGSEIAVEKSDDAFLTKLQNVVLGDFTTFLNTGSLTGTATTWQAALAKAQGEVLNKFAGMAKDVTLSSDLRISWMLTITWERRTSPCRPSLESTTSRTSWDIPPCFCFPRRFR